MRDVPVYLQAAAIAKAAYERNPDHPGAAHYWIHGMDDPDHAAEALVAARSLSKIAPDAGHAQHMCSHIFMALGMWDDVVDANLNAMRVVDDQRRAAGRPILDCGHYVIWLQYAYYQQGRHQEGDKALAACQSTAKDALAWMDAHPDQPSSSPTCPATPYRTQQQQSRHDARDHCHRFPAVARCPAVAMVIDPAGLGTDAGWDIFTTGYAAAQRGDVPAAQESQKNLEKMINAYHAHPNADHETGLYLDVLADDLSGLISSKTGNMEAATMQVQRAAATYDGMAFDFGPPPILKPPQELLGELLLKDGKPKRAREAFEASLKRAPNRTQSLLGLARAQDAAGDKAGAIGTYQQLVAIWKNADADNQDVTEARNYIAAGSKK